MRQRGHLHVSVIGNFLVVASFSSRNIVAKLRVTSYFALIALIMMT